MIPAKQNEVITLNTSINIKSIKTLFKTYFFCDHLIFISNSYSTIQIIQHKIKCSKIRKWQQFRAFLHTCAMTNSFSPSTVMPRLMTPRTVGKRGSSHPSTRPCSTNHVSLRLDITVLCRFRRLYSHTWGRRNSVQCKWHRIYDIYAWNLIIKSCRCILTFIFLNQQSLADILV